MERKWPKVIFFPFLIHYLSFVSQHHEISHLSTLQILLAYLIYQKFLQFLLSTEFPATSSDWFSMRAVHWFLFYIRKFHRLFVPNPEEKSSSRSWYMESPLVRSSRVTSGLPLFFGGRETSSIPQSRSSIFVGTFSEGVGSLTLRAGFGLDVFPREALSDSFASFLKQNERHQVWRLSFCFRKLAKKTRRTLTNFSRYCGTHVVHDHWSPVPQLLNYFSLSSVHETKEMHSSSPYFRLLVTVDYNRRVHCECPSCPLLPKPTNYQRNFQRFLCEISQAKWNAPRLGAFHFAWEISQRKITRGDLRTARSGVCLIHGCCSNVFALTRIFSSFWKQRNNTSSSPFEIPSGIEGWSSVTILDGHARLESYL